MINQKIQDAINNQINNSRILIVEDEAIIALDIESVLHSHGYSNTQIVSSGERCIEEIMENNADLVLMDISLDGDLNGIDTAGIIKERYSTPVIFLTAYSEKIVLQKVKEVSPYGYLIKPINARELYAIVETSLHRNSLDIKVRESELKFRTLFEQSRDAIYICDNKGVIKDINQAMVDLLDYSFEEANGMNISKVFVSQEDVDNIVSGLLINSFVEDYEASLMSKTGKRIDCSISLAVMKGLNGEHQDYQGIIRDITEQKQIQKMIMESVEKERQRIGRDLHDGLGQIITGTGFLCELLIKKLTERDIPELSNAQEIYKLLKEAKDHTRNIARGISPMNIREDGLSLSIKQLCLNMEQLFGISCSLSCDEQIIIEDDMTATHLYYIIMEAANNSLRHGKAENINIEIKMDRNRIIVRVKDDGTGMDENDQNRNEGMGFHIMKYRAGLIGATLNIGRADTGGTLVSCMLK